MLEDFGELGFRTSERDIANLSKAHAIVLIHTRLCRS